MTILEPIPYGYRVYTGIILSDADVDRYNFLTDRCNAAIKAGIKPSEGLLNEKHRCFVLASNPSTSKG